MLKVLSTHIFLRQRLHTGLLELAARTGADGVEVFAARQHFDYANRQEVQDLAAWFRSNELRPVSIHAPLYPDREMGRAGAPVVNLLHPEKSRRIDAMDEIKRALEAAELIPFERMVIHLGDRHEPWSPRALEYSLTALEHLRAFANPLGVKLAVENIENEVTRPEHIREIFSIGHFKDIGVCLDTGHAHLGEGVMNTLMQLRDLITTTHLHDNHGNKDEHLWPGDGAIEWKPVVEELAQAPNLKARVLEIHHSLEESNETLVEKAKQAFGLFQNDENHSSR